MARLALQHGVAATGGRLAAGWKQKRDRLHRQICRQGFNRGLGSFVRSFGSNKLDASALLLPIFGFLPFEDERVIGMELIQKSSAARVFFIVICHPTKTSRSPPLSRVPSGWLKISQAQAVESRQNDYLKGFSRCGMTLACYPKNMIQTGDVSWGTSPRPSPTSP